LVAACAPETPPCYVQWVVPLVDDDALPLQPEEDESRLAAKLGDDGLQEIDAALQQHTRARWLKVARVIADALEAGGFDPSAEGAADLHLRRLIGLVDSGLIEAQGNLRRPRWSEVRLPRNVPRSEPPQRPPSPLEKAVIAGDLARAQVLIKRGANISEPGQSGWSLLHRAAVNNHPELVELLLHHGALLEARGTISWTVLHLACVNGCVRAIAVLIKAGADVNSVTRDGNTPLHLDVTSGTAEAIQMLLSGGANPNAINGKGKSPADEARSAGRIDLAELIGRAGHKAV
jgi:hypothetical protein